MFFHSAALRVLFFFIVFFFFFDSCSADVLGSFLKSTTTKSYTGIFKGPTDIIKIFEKEFIDPYEIDKLSSQLSMLQNVLKYNQTLDLTLFIKNNSINKYIQSVSIQLDPSKTLLIKRVGSTFKTTLNINKNIHKEDIRISHEINKSIREISSHEAPDYVIDKLLLLYAPYMNLDDIPNPGKIDFLIQIFYEGNKIIKFGEVLYTSFSSQDKRVILYKHQFKDGTTEFVNVAGNTAIGIRISHLDFTIPVPSNVRISSNFGRRINPVTGVLGPHNGVDFATAHGTPIKAANSGKIVYMGNKYGYGKYVRIAHEHGYETAYAHLSQFSNKLKVGSYVKRGDVIARSGNSGRTTGPHLHYEVIHHGKHIDPMKIHKSIDYAQNFSKEELKVLKDNIDKIKKVFASAPTMKKIL